MHCAVRQRKFLLLLHNGLRGLESKSERVSVCPSADTPELVSVSDPVPVSKVATKPVSASVPQHTLTSGPLFPSEPVQHDMPKRAPPPAPSQLWTVCCQSPQVCGRQPEDLPWHSGDALLGRGSVTPPLSLSLWTLLSSPSCTSLWLGFSHYSMVLFPYKVCATLVDYFSRMLPRYGPLQTFISKMVLYVVYLLINVNE